MMIMFNRPHCVCIIFCASTAAADPGVCHLDEVRHQELEARLASVAGFREQQGSIAREMQYLRNERDRAKQEVADQVHEFAAGATCGHYHAWLERQSQA